MNRIAAICTGTLYAVATLLTAILILYTWRIFGWLAYWPLTWMGLPT